MKKETKISFNIHVQINKIYFLPNKESKLNYFEKSQKDGIFTFKYNIN